MKNKEKSRMKSLNESSFVDVVCYLCDKVENLGDEECGDDSIVESFAEVIVQGKMYQVQLSLVYNRDEWVQENQIQLRSVEIKK